MSISFTEKQYKQETLVVDRFQDVFESITFFNETSKTTSCLDNMKTEIFLKLLTYCTNLIQF